MDRVTAGGDAVAIVFTDVEGSTSLLRRLGVDAFADLLGWHLASLETHTLRLGGRVGHIEGDGALLLFPAVDAAVAAVAAAQRELEADGRLRVRMAVHVGEARFVGDQLVGIGIHEAARILPAAHGGQVLLSEPARRRAGPLEDGLGVVALGAYRLRDHPTEVPLHRLVGSGLPAVDAPPRAVPAGAHALPLPSAPMIGRDAELGRIRTSLESERLVTLVGPPGVGTSRLGAEAARELAPKMADGTWWLGFAAAGDAAEPARALAASLALDVAPDDDAVAAVQAALLGRQVLVVLDGVVHGAERVAALAADLVAVPGPSLLVTARGPLGVGGEVVVRVAPLPTPAPRAPAPDVLANPAAILFADRARRADPTFVLDAANAPLVGAVCRATEGLPLALELAAARLAGGGLDALLEHLRDLADDPDSGAVMTELVDLAFLRVGDDARKLHRRLAVVEWPVDVDLAVHVSGLEPAQVRRALDELVAHSLLEPQHVGDRPQWAQLGEIRRHAARALTEEGERATAEAGFARWSQSVLAAHPDTLVDRTQIAVHRAAFDAASAVGGDLVRKLAIETWPAFERRGLLAEARHRANVALASDAGPDDGLEGPLLAIRAVTVDDPTDARTDALAALAVDDLPSVHRSTALRVLSDRLLPAQPAAAADRAREAAEAAETTGDAAGAASAWALLVRAHLVGGDLPAARAALRRASDAADEAGDPHVQRIVLQTEVEVARHVGDAPRAIRSAEELVEQIHDDEDWSRLVGAAWVLADLAVSDGDQEVARRAVTRLVEAAERSPSPLGLVLAYGYAQGVALDARRIDEAREHTERLHALLPLLHDQPTARRAIRFADLAVAAATNDLPRLRAAVDRVAPTAEDLADPAFLLAHGFVLVQALNQLGRHDEALDLARRGTPVVAAAYEPLLEGLYRLHAAIALTRLARPAEAVDELATTLRLATGETAGALVAPALLTAADLIGAASPERATWAVLLLAACEAEHERTGTIEAFERDEAAAIRERAEDAIGVGAAAASARRGATLDRDSAVDAALAALRERQA